MRPSRNFLDEIEAGNAVFAKLQRVRRAGRAVACPDRPQAITALTGIFHAGAFENPVRPWRDGHVSALCEAS